MSHGNIELLRNASIEDAFFLDHQLINMLRSLQVNNLEQLSTLPLECLTHKRNLGVTKIEGVARLLRAAGVERPDLFEFLNQQKLGVDEEILARYIAVGTRLPSTLYVHELREPNRIDEVIEHTRWLKDRRIANWRELLADLSKSRQRDRRISLTLGAVAGSVNDASRKDPYLTLKELRLMDADSLVQIAETSKWRGIHEPQAAMLLKIFTPVKQPIES